MSRRTFSVLVSLGLLVSIVPVLPAGADHTPAPTSVVIAGSLQDELGCPGDWQPECAASGLAYDASDDVWQGAFDLPAGSWEYKAAMNGTWDEAYGLGGGGANIPLGLTDAATVKFLYDHDTHWVTDNVNSVIATAAGSFQEELGCPGDWQPDCLRSWLQDKDGDGVYEFATTEIPAGSYEFKVTLNEAWDTSYPGSNVPFTTADGDLVTITYDAATTDVAVTVDSAPPPGPSSVTIAGSLQSELGCPGDWQPDCAATHLTYDANDDVWQGTFALPAGSYEYKAALDDAWDENYGAGAGFNGANISLELTAPTDVKFYYDHKTHWVTDNVNATVATFAGSFQSELGCPGDWQPDCLQSWLQDPDGDGTYEFTTSAIPPGDYEGKVALDEDWAISHPAGNVAFTASAGATVTVTYDSATNDVSVDPGAGTSEPGDELLVRPPVRIEAQDNVFYFVLPDRFDNGDPSNDTAGSASADVLDHGFLPTDKAYYHGGDLAGLTARLPYLDGLGVNAVWMTPQFTNRWVQPDSSTFNGYGAGYHGYWQIDYSSIDPHFGTNAEMQAFVAAAHALGIDVFFDIVANHTGDVIQYAEGDGLPYISKSDQPYLDADGAAFDDADFAGTGTFPPLDANVSFPYTPTFDSVADQTVKSPAWLNDPTLYHNRGNSTFSGENSLYGDFFGLDDLWTEHPTVQDGLIQVFKDMVTDFDVDGFRIDTVKHVNDEFWEAFAPEVEAHAASLGKPNFFVFGEVFDGDPVFTSRFTTELPLDAVLDFGFQGSAGNFAAGSGATDSLAAFYASGDYYTDTDSNAYSLPLFLGNHDVGRIGMFLSDTNAGATDTELLARDELAHALMYFGRGMPVIYYGDEQGFTGDGGDKDARQDMMPSVVPSYNDDDLIATAATTADSNFDETHPLYQTLADFSALLDAHPALRRGAQLHRYSEPNAGIYAFSRIERTERIEYVVALNNSESADTATFDTDSPSTTFTELWPGGGPAITTDASGNLTVDVPALGVTLYKADAGIAVPAIAPVVTMTGPTAGAEVLGRVEVGASLSSPAYTEVTFAVSIDGGAFEPIGTDDNAPYRVFYDVSDLAPGTSVEFKAIADNMSGNISSGRVAAVVGADEPPSPGGDAAYAIIHYFRSDGDYGDHTTGDYNDFWGLHLWGDAIDPSEATEWTSPKPFLGEDEYGRFAWIKLADSTQPLNFIVHRGDTKDGTDADRSFIPGISPEIWLMQGDGSEYTSQAGAQGYVTIHYNRTNGDYGDPTSSDYNDFWGLHLWGDAIDSSEGTEWTSPKKPTGFDGHGAYWQVLLADPTAQLNFIIHRGDEKNTGPDEFFFPVDQATVWKQQADEALYRTRAAAENTAVIHYHRPDGDYGDSTSPDFNDFWGLHVWTGAASPTEWQDPVRPAGQDLFGVYFEVPLAAGADGLNYIIHRGDAKDPGPDQRLELGLYGHEVWQLSGADPEDPYILPILGGGAVSLDNLDKQQAYWVDERTLVWPAAEDPTDTYTLHWSATASLTADAAGITGGDGFVTLAPAGTFTGVEGFLHLDGMPALQIAEADRAMIPAMLQGQVAVAATSADHVRIDAAGIQIPGVLDDLYFYDGDLGVVWSGGAPTVNLWAPTAQSVTFHLFADSDPTTVSSTSAMDDTNGDGVWTMTGDPSWNGQFYLYEIDVYAPTTGAIETNIVTDPYSVSLAMNSTRSQIVDLADSALEPDGWESLQKPELAAPEDITLYELHVRDFSVSDPAVPDALQGTFKAFTVASNGTAHLETLGDAGLTHIHLLPAFDIATINENKAEWQEPDPDVLATYPPDSDQQQAAVTAVEDLDGFNWGYDPFHYTVPEGSYSTNPDGVTRIVEFREMVQSLNESGLRVVMDVVYNHTNASGQAEKSVLDKVVPGYYHRLNADGAVETSTCCANTATEHAMMEKLMVDSLVTWARDYKVDGFRFDLMGHHSLANMEKVEAALQAIDPNIYLYGEGWNFGEVANDARFVQATQLNMFETGIGTFNDRLRDAVRGGGPFDDGLGLRINQGVINGLWYDRNVPNLASMTEQQALDELLLSADQIRVGLAGNLAEYMLEDRNGTNVMGSQVDYNGSPTGYTGDPQEHIIYVSAHDNQTLFDINQYHNPVATSMADRLRTQNLGIDFTVLSQGVPFFHAGVDMLRSKSLDRDSFNSGDWFNKLDYTYETNNWGVGLPVAGKNQSNWGVIQPLLADAALTPAKSDIQAAAEHLPEMLEIRNSSPLFRLQTAQEVKDRLAFHNTGSGQVPGVIVMSISDTVGSDLDPNADAVFAVFNSVDEDLAFTVAALAGLPIELHPTLATSVDAVVQGADFDEATGTFTVPARTTAVFVQAEPDTEAPTVTAELEGLRVYPHIGTFRVRFSCTDDTDPNPATVAAISGVPVADGERVALIETRRREDHLRIGRVVIIWGPGFELLVTCTDASGNVGTAIAVAEFPRRGFPWR